MSMCSLLRVLFVGSNYQAVEYFLQSIRPASRLQVRSSHYTFGRDLLHLRTRKHSDVQDNELMNASVRRICALTSTMPLFRSRPLTILVPTPLSVASIFTAAFTSPFKASKNCASSSSLDPINSSPRCWVVSAAFAFWCTRDKACRRRKGARPRHLVE